MWFWKEIPFFRFFLFFTSGLLLANFYSCETYALWLLFFSIALLFALRKNQTISSFLCFVILVLAGLYSGRTPHRTDLVIGKANIQSTITEVFSSGKSIARVNFCAVQHTWVENGGLIFIKDSLGLLPGQTFCATGSFKAVSSLSESGWKKFLIKKNIGSTATLFNISNVSESENVKDRYRFYCFSIKKKIHDYLRSTIPGKNEADLVLSLLMGGTSHLDPELQSDFRNSGVMHIIAVSGMHLSLLFLVVAEFIFFIKRNRKIDFITLIVSLSFIWTYAAVTGFSSSVLRAAVMFTVMLFSNRSRRGYHSWNSLFLSAFVLLFLFPDMLYDLGFHLSYLAVAGIFLSQPLLLKIRFEPVAWKRNLLSATVMSLAAQVMVSPYLVCLFGTFSPAFLIANLIMVPLSSAAVYTGIVHLIFAIAPFLSTLSGYVNYLVVALLIWFAKAFSWTILLHVDFLECMMMYLIIGLILIFIFYKNKKSFVLATLCSVFLCGYHLVRWEVW